MRRVLIFCALAVAALLLLAFGLANFWALLAVFALFLMIWGFAFWRLPAYTGRGFPLALLFAGFGLWVDTQQAQSTLQFWLVAAAVFAALAGWDMADFAARLQNVSVPEARRALYTRHGRAVGQALLLGLILLVLARNLSIDLPFGVMLTLALLASIALGLLIRRLLKRA
jgi:hypothetical protein